MLSDAQHRRHDRLRLFISAQQRVREDSPGAVALAAPAEVARYAATQFDGRDCWISLHDDRDDAVAYLAGEAQSEDPWAPGAVLDLDTGRGWRAVVTVQLQPWPPETVAKYADVEPLDR